MITSADIEYRDIFITLRTGIAACSREIQDADINYWHPGHKYKANCRIKVVLFNKVGTPVEIASALFQLCEGSKIIEVFQIAEMLFVKNCLWRCPDWDTSAQVPVESAEF